MRSFCVHTTLVLGEKEYCDLPKNSTILPRVRHLDVVRDVLAFIIACRGVYKNKDFVSIRACYARQRVISNFSLAQSSNLLVRSIKLSFQTDKNNVVVVPYDHLNSLSTSTFFFVFGKSALP